MATLSNTFMVQLLFFLHAVNVGKVSAAGPQVISNVRNRSSRVKRLILMERVPSSSTAITRSSTTPLSLPPGILTADRAQTTVDELPQLRSPTTARATTPRATTARATTARATTPRATTARATTPRATTARATTARATTARATTARATTARATTARATTARATSARATTPRATSARATSARATSARATSARATTPRATTARATTPRATTARATSARATSARATSARATKVSSSAVVLSTSPPNAMGCSGNFTSTSVPISVHNLKVGDINVVAAMGDSLTAGNGAKASNVFGVLTEDRGQAFSIGGDLSYTSGVTTLPNILKMFNPDVYGFSVGAGDHFSQGSRLNVARAGAVARDMRAQAVSLISKLMADPQVNYTTDWKVVTIFVGGNDLCNACLDPTIHTAAVYKAGLESALDIMHSRMPRTLVNVVEVFDINVVAHLASNNFLCAFVIGSICPCGIGGSVNRPALRALAMEYRRGLEGLVSTGKYDTRADFTVVIQPFFSSLTLPHTPAGRTDFTYFAPDCFHLSEKGQRAAGKALWNNMVQPPRSKQTDLLPMASTSCPTTEYIPTRLN